MGDFDSQIEALTNQVERQEERRAQREQARKLAAMGPQATPTAADERRRSLELVRASLADQMQAARSDRFRERLQLSLDAVDAEIASLDQ